MEDKKIKITIIAMTILFVIFLVWNLKLEKRIDTLLEVDKESLGLDSLLFDLSREHYQILDQKIEKTLKTTKAWVDSIYGNLRLMSNTDEMLNRTDSILFELIKTQNKLPEVNGE